MKKHYQLKITGKVQGVWFRTSTQRKANELGLTGFVRNEPDGSVYIEIEGDVSSLKAMIEWCWEGPPFARVGNVGIEELPLQGFTSFEINR